MIDGQPAGTIPCCSGRADVAAAFPDNPDALNSGWGAVFNYGTLTPGRHEIEIVQAGPGYSSSLSHMVWVVRPGGFEFIDQVDLSQATAQIVRVHPWSLPEDDEIHLEGVNVRDKATGQTKIISISLRWFQHSQALGVVAASEE
jgi:hypothetical protein